MPNSNLTYATKCGAALEDITSSADGSEHTRTFTKWYHLFPSCDSLMEEVELTYCFLPNFTLLALTYKALDGT